MESEFNAEVLSEQELLVGGVADLLAENQASARRWVRMVELYRRQPDTEGNFRMSARDWTALKVSEAWGMSDRDARRELNRATFLSEHLPEVIELCLAGALDRRRAVIIADLMRNRLHDRDAWARCGERVIAYLRRHLRVDEETGVELVRCTPQQLRNKLNYETRVLAPVEEFEPAHADRRVNAMEFEDGTGRLGIGGTAPDVRLARHRLHLAARAKRAAGDARTVDQLMADVAMDLIIGRAVGVPVPGYARPIINVTVSLETLAGISEDPGRLSGGTVIPPELARAIATQEGATWYRMLTDPAGELVTLSTKTYQPTAPIWRFVVADRPTCSHPGCDRPSTECELDHEVEWPVGPTDTDNLQPLCKLHHRAKHARAGRPDLDWEYEAA